jgi:tRNA wybutosine-synthesizing protein 3
MGLGFESLIGQQAGGESQCVVTAEYLRSLLNIANDRFGENEKRIKRFRDGLQQALQAPKPKMSVNGEEWEDAAARRERKRMEGLQKKAQSQAGRAAKTESPEEDLDLDSIRDA